MDILSPVQYLKSVGPKRAESFAKIGVNTIRDLLFYFPSRYLDRRTILNSSQVISYLSNGYEGEVTIIGTVVDSESIYYSRRQILKVKMRDQAGSFECVWFQGAKYFKDTFKAGDHFAISAKPVLTKYGHLQFAHPDFDKLAEKESTDFTNTGMIIPFYRIPKELKSANLGDFSLRKIISNAVEQYSEYVSESLLDDVINRNNLLELKISIKQLHSPESEILLAEARRRMKFEEIFYFECLVAIRHKSHKKLYTPIMSPNNFVKRFLKNLSFELTKSQLHVLSEIRGDLESGMAMNRLLQGDVGSGKTVVALIAMIMTAEWGGQSIIMAPTEILADQHYKRIRESVHELGIQVDLLIGGQKSTERSRILNEISNGNSKIIIGTHALIEQNVVFKNLSLVVIDEQHRFGVLQRSNVIEKASVPNVLIMTATPIPRTLTMTIYGDLDISIINEMPKNRKAIKTVIRSESKLPAVYDFIKEKTKNGYQTFLVYPLVEDSDKIELKAAISYFEELKSSHLSELRLGLIHGKMNWREKEKIMFEFAQKEYDVLVSTTVIEVGIDIPDANIIVVNDAFRFGLSQLHQLRGRVGRSDKSAYCILIVSDELAKRSANYNYNFDYMSKEQIEKNKAVIRLNAMAEQNDGFKLSEIDFILRGPGNIFGTEQSGLPEFKYVDFINDAEIIQTAKDEAFKLIESDPNLSSKNNTLIKKNLLNTYSQNIFLSHIA